MLHLAPHIMPLTNSFGRCSCWTWCNGVFGQILYIVDCSFWCNFLQCCECLQNPQAKLAPNNEIPLIFLVAWGRARRWRTLRWQHRSTWLSLALFSMMLDEFRLRHRSQSLSLVLFFNVAWWISLAPPITMSQPRTFSNVAWRILVAPPITIFQPNTFSMMLDEFRWHHQSQSFSLVLFQCCLTNFGGAINHNTSVWKFFQCCLTNYGGATNHNLSTQYFFFNCAWRISVAPPITIFQPNTFFNCAWRISVAPPITIFQSSTFSMLLDQFRWCHWSTYLSFFFFNDAWRILVVTHHMGSNLGTSNLGTPYLLDKDHAIRRIKGGSIHKCHNYWLFSVGHHNVFSNICKTVRK